MAIITKNEIIAAITYWGIRQSPYDFPVNLENALIALSKKIDEKKIFKTPEKKTTNSYLEITDEQITDLIKDLIFNTPEIAIWNVTKIEQDKGITDPNDEKRTVKFAATSRYGAMQVADRDFIDLDALRQNVCGMLYENHSVVS
ncbi:MAG: hypothetical protein WCT77_04085 [Bacteroidota bacterium]